MTLKSFVVDGAEVDRQPFLKWTTCEGLQIPNQSELLLFKSGVLSDICKPVFGSSESISDLLEME